MSIVNSNNSFICLALTDTFQVITKALQQFKMFYKQIAGQTSGHQTSSFESQQFDDKSCAIQNDKVISMKSSQKYSKKDFSLSQYYNQLQRYETGLAGSKKTPLKKEYSLSSFTKDPSKTSTHSKNYKDSFVQERPRLGLADTYSNKGTFDKFDRNKLENIKKHNSPVEHFKTNSYLGESLNSSNITYKQWNNNDSRIQKENIPFGRADEQKFVEHCSQLYNINSNDNLVYQIEKQISKRDEVYQVIADNFPNEPEEHYSSRLKQHFAEYELMAKIIEQFKSISKLEVDDLNELHYFLKSDH